MPPLNIPSLPTLTINYIEYRQNWFCSNMTDVKERETNEERQTRLVNLCHHLHISVMAFHINWLGEERMIALDVQSSEKGQGRESFQSPLVLLDSILAIVIIYAITHTDYVPIIVTPHLPQVRHGCGLLGICKSRLTNSPPLRTILCCKSPTFCIGIPKTMKIHGQMPQPWEQIMLTNRYKSPSRCPTRGRRGLTMIGALHTIYKHM